MAAPSYESAPQASRGPSLYRFLIVGCGGSGGATLSYMQDQLRSDLAARGISKIPTGWQFVHVDVPLAEDPGPEGLLNVQQGGGTYIPLGLASGSYPELDEIVSDRVGAHEHLELIGSWAARNPGIVRVPLMAGAGQLRSVGRMVTLHKAAQLRDQLRTAWLKLSEAGVEAEMRSLREFGSYDPAQPPIVLVVTSMAGGAGASMALDVCRILASLPLYSPRLAGVFMVGADVFASLSPAHRTGVMPNALAMFGEIVATQAGQAAKADKGLLESLGLNEVGTPIPFARVFPVNLYQGGDSMTIVGDGTPQAVYRALARGLSSLMTSPQATYPFVNYDLTNEVGPQFDQKLFGWGSDSPRQLEWGSFGYASLSMGRDRFAEYVAQRLSSRTVRRLVDGHLFEGATADGLEQLRQRTESMWPHECAAMGMWGGPNSNEPRLGEWLAREAFPAMDAQAISQGLVRQHILDQLPSGVGNVVARDWIMRVRQVFAAARPGLATAIDHQAYAWAARYCDQLLDRTVAVVARGTSAYGLAYASRIVQLLKTHISSTVQPALRDLASFAPEPLDTIDPQVGGLVDSMKGALQGSQELVGRIATRTDGIVQQHLYVAACRMLQAVLPSYVEEVLTPLESELGARLSELAAAREARPGGTGVAHVATTSVADWPHEQEPSPARRWYQATNEVLLTTPDQYHQHFSGLVMATANKAGRYPEALEDLVSAVAAGEWETQDGSPPPRDLVMVTRRWVPVALATNPMTGEVKSQQIAGFDVRATSAAVLDRARQFVARRGAPFHTFTSQSLRSYASGPETVREITTKFQQALTRALPLAKVDASMVLKLYGMPVSYRYKFSAVPFQQHALEAPLRNTLEQSTSIAPEAVSAFNSALTASQTATRIDVFGSYPCYVPLCFDSVFSPIVDEWNHKKGTFQQGDFWSFRKSRPIPGVLPVTETERRALIAGWYLGQITGRVTVPAPPYSSHVPPAQIWLPQANEWRPFVDVMLTRVSDMQSTTADWLPAVLESQLLAMARAHEAPVTESLVPYRALREIFDDHPSGQRNWGQALSGTIPFSGQAVLTEWLRTGATPPGGTSRAAAPADAADPVQARRDAAIAYLDRMERICRESFMPPTGKFGRIRDRATASQMPVMRDLADDVVMVCETLRQVVDLALRDASASGTGGGRTDVSELM